jgi:nitrogen fixation NifU-like protein
VSDKSNDADDQRPDLNPEWPDPANVYNWAGAASVRKQVTMSADMYREQILDLARNPVNHGTLEPNDASYEDTNPLCGDRVRIDLCIGDGVVQDIAFSGRGCAISQAAASMLTEMVKGQSVSDAAAITNDEMLDELGVEISPARIKCALLGLHVLRVALDEYQRNGATSTDVAMSQGGGSLA